MYIKSILIHGSTVNPVAYEGGRNEHLNGTPGKIDEIRDVCNRHGAVMIIEDAAESLGASYKGVQTGVFGTYM